MDLINELDEKDLMFGLIENELNIWNIIKWIYIYMFWLYKIDCIVGSFTVIDSYNWLIFRSWKIE